MEEQIQHLIEAYEKRYQVCLQMMKEAEMIKDINARAEAIRYYHALSLLWKLVVKDLKAIRR